MKMNSDTSNKTGGASASQAKTYNLLCCRCQEVGTIVKYEAVFCSNECAERCGDYDLYDGQQELNHAKKPTYEELEKRLIQQANEILHLKRDLYALLKKQNPTQARGQYDA